MTTVPPCPFRACVGRESERPERRTTPLPAAETQMAGIGAPPPLFRCSVCGGVWREPVVGIIEPLGVLVGQRGFEAFEHPRAVELARGRLYPLD